ncbi:pseudoazurin [Roseomonas sp. M0104]|uniref:Pseudoazurin n=1 Tax=Teichococcus coralli TaxID=2545983 RepID=A0A845BDP9_9PROT|nr:pseudoazurin [Pseudoroseomonas coralli]MXP64174.1 pseudoazurin [Pseudoroseomonas coralli]
MSRLIASALALPLLLAVPAAAAEVEVHALNRGGNGAMMVFEPALVRIQPGDTVRFVATDKGHNAESVPGMLPDGAEAFAGRMNETITITFDKPGVYGIRCKPHYGMGMVALVAVGALENEAAARGVGHPGRAKQVFGQLFGALDGQLAAVK